MTYGVTQQMIDTFGEVVFKLSLNIQSRPGDAVRELDWDTISAQRDRTGLTDHEIAERIGLLPEQVAVVRVFTERKYHKIDQHRKIFNLGGGKRWDPEKYKSPAERLRFNEAGMALRKSLSFDPERAAHYLEKGYWTNDTLSAWLAKYASETAEAIAINHPGGNVSYGELKERVDSLTTGLMNLGLIKGDVVAVQLPNNIDYILSYLAITAFGGVMQTIHMPYRDADIEFLLGHSRARAVISLPALKDFQTGDVMLKLKNQLDTLEHVIITGDTAPKGALTLAAIFSDDTPEIDNPPVGSDPFLLLYTSGTTSNPKGVPLTYQNMLSNTRQCAPEYKVTADDRILSAAPFGHLYGLYNLHLALFAGGTATLLPMFTPPDLAALVEKEKPTMVFLGPPHAAAMLGAGLMDKHDFSSVRFTVFSGAYCPPEVMKTYHAKAGGGKTGQLWGMTETAAGTISRPDDDIEIPANSAGRATPGDEIRVVSTEEGAPLPADTEGELQVRGCSVFAGYLDNQEANDEAFAGDGWFRTGDLAMIDRDGNMRITGRTKDVINRGGVKFNPADIEDLISKHAKVAEAAIVPMSDPVLGEKSCCFAVAAAGENPNLEELCAYLDDNKISKNKWPERLELIDEMPLTPTRKVMKGQLAASLAEDH